MSERRRKLAPTVRRLTQTGEDSGGASSQYPMSGSYDSARFIPQSQCSSTLESFWITDRGSGNGQIVGSFRRRWKFKRREDSQRWIARGVWVGYELCGWDISGCERNRRFRKRSSAPAGVSPSRPRQPPYRRPLSVALPTTPEMVRTAEPL